MFSQGGFIHYFVLLSLLNNVPVGSLRLFRERVNKIVSKLVGLHHAFYLTRDIASHMRVFPCKIKRKLIKATPVPEGHGRAELNFAYTPKILFDVTAKTNISQCLNNFCSFSYEEVHVKKLETLNFPSSQFFEVYNEIFFQNFQISS